MVTDDLNTRRCNHCKPAFSIKPARDVFSGHVPDIMPHPVPFERMTAPRSARA
jgi:hypothetical protein